MNRRERTGEKDSLYMRRGQYRPKYSKSLEDIREQTRKNMKSRKDY